MSEIQYHKKTSLEAGASRETAFSPSVESLKKDDVGVSLDDEESFDTEGGLSRKTLHKMYRKLDYRIVPALWCFHFLVSFGGDAYGLTLTMNRKEHHSLSKKLGLTAHYTALATTFYYIGFIVFDIPMNLIMTKVSPHWWLARLLITVGLIYTCYSVVSDRAGIFTLRFMSGFAAAGGWPGLTYYVSLWYPEARLTKRIGYYFTAAKVASAFTGLASAGFQQMDGLHGYTGWQWMYLIYGVITIAAGISLVWWLPDRPHPRSSAEDDVAPKSLWKRITKFFESPYPLNNTEREVHLKEIDSNQKLQWTVRDVIEVATDLRLWPLILMYFGGIGCGQGLANYASTIIAEYNPKLSSVDVSLLTVPMWCCDLLGILVVTPFVDKMNGRRAHFFGGGCFIIIIGLFISTFTKNVWGKYVGLLISGFGLGPVIPICMAWTVEIFSTRYGEIGAAVSSAFVTSLGSLGTITTTYALYKGWPADQARKFKFSNMVMVCLLTVSIVSSVVLHFIQHRVRQKS